MKEAGTHTNLIQKDKSYLRFLCLVLYEEAASIYFLFQRMRTINIALLALCFPFNLIVP